MSSFVIQGDYRTLDETFQQNFNPMFLFCQHALDQNNQLGIYMPNIKCGFRSKSIRVRFMGA